MEEFIIKQGRFEGPYAKLLEMIEARKLSISEISLASVADEYINYTKSLQEKNIGDISKFVLIAATLMLIKAKSLLPQIEYSEEEEKQVEDLTKKLELMQELKRAEELVKGSWGKNILMSKDKTSLDEITTFSPTPKFTKENIYSVAMLTLANMPSYEKLKNIVVKQTIRIEEVIERMIIHIQDSFTSLKDFAKSINKDPGKIKESLIVSFLALLEIVKLGKIDAEEVDGDIKIIKKEL